MSRIGKTPVKIPSGVEVVVTSDLVKVKGPKGELTQEIKGGIKTSVSDGQVIFSAERDDKQTKAYWGLYRSLVANMVKGVTEGFRKDLEIIGVGYRASKKGNGISLNVGYSHPVDFEAPAGVALNVEENTKISVMGADKNLVGLTASKIRAIRAPEPYKGKGIKYTSEVVRRKAGKAAAKSA